VDLRISAPDAADIAAKWAAKTTAMEVAVRGIVAHHSMLLLTQIQSHASGRPGPNAPTGDYRRSWTIEWRGMASASVGTNKPQGRRLENGFVGADSLGRVYNQPPFPHVEPSVSIVEPMFVSALGAYAATL
jgi:hypothetical protein